METPYHKLEQRLQETVSSARLELRELPLCPELKLHLLSDDFPKGPLPHDEMMAVLREPAYWAFCWASGQVLARYLMVHPHMSAGKTILDFGAGSGVVGVAAALCGAKKVICCDIDEVALLACKANAAANGVEVELLDDIEKLDCDLDWLITADVLYDRDNYPWIDKLRQLAPEVLIADSRVKQAKLKGYEVVDRLTATTVPDLDEFKEFSDVRVYRSSTA